MNVPVTDEQLAQLRAFAPTHAAVIEKINAAEPAKRSRRTASAPSARRAAKAAAAPAPAQDEALVVDLTDYTDRLTMGDMEDMERVSGTPALSMRYFGGPDATIRGTSALIWVLKRKDDKRFTYAMARDLPLRQVMRVMDALNAAAEAEEAEGEADPLAAARSLPNA